MCILFKNKFCEIKELEFHPGKQYINRYSQIGGPSILKRGTKELDKATFKMSKCHEINIKSKYDLRDDNGIIINIIIERSTVINNNQYFVSAAIVG